MHTPSYRYIFGPVQSRRLGRSLGIDLLDRRRCSFDCIFCEVGKTDILTLERAEYVPTDAVIKEFHDWLVRDGQADVVTLAGSGEPTLHVEFGKVIAAVHAACDKPVVLLTNSTLLGDPDVRRDAAHADIVKASLSVWDDASLNKLNRPANGLAFSELLDGIQCFRNEYNGQFWIETLLVKGINDSPEQVSRIARHVEHLKANKVQLNTIVRPPATPNAQATEHKELEALAGLFTPQAEIISRYQNLPDGERHMSEHISELARLGERRSTNRT